MSLTSIRLHVEAPLSPGSTIALADAQAHYLATVMRAAPGDTLRAFNGQDGEYLLTVQSVSRKSVTLRCLHQTRGQAAEPDCWLCFALLKRHKTDFAVEKATELGAAVIQPILTARTNADHVNLERLRAIATEAAEQCERLAVPEIRAPIPLARLLETWPHDRRLAFADERRLNPVLSPFTGPSALLIGPEGGFTEAEVDTVAAQPFVTRVSLGARILRAETAAIAGLTLLLAAAPPQE